MKIQPRGPKHNLAQGWLIRGKAQPGSYFCTISREVYAAVFSRTIKTHMDSKKIEASNEAGPTMEPNGFQLVIFLFGPPLPAHHQTILKYIKLHFEIMSQVNPIGAMKLFGKPECSLCMRLL